MTIRFTWPHGLLALAVLGLALAGGPALPPAAAQAPAPTQASPTQAPPPQASEQMLLGYPQGDIRGRITIPDQRAAQLIQPEGRDFQHFWRSTMKWLAAATVGGIVVLLALFYAGRGKVRIKAGPAGRTIERFGGFERFAHWLTASCFIVLGITGLSFGFGRDLLLPLVGHEAFAAWARWSKVAHNFLSFPFTLGLLLMLVIWIRDNIPGRVDARWFAAGGGLVGRAHAPARRFNGGQKALFWLVVLGGGALAATGFALIFPFRFVTTIGGMQGAAQLHGVIALVMIAIILAHIYIGSIGMEGAFSAMGSGRVDLNWAKEHHDLWVEEIMAGGRGEPPLGGRRRAGAD